MGNRIKSSIAFAYSRAEFGEEGSGKLPAALLFTTASALRCRVHGLAPMAMCMRSTVLSPMEVAGEMDL